MRQVRCGRAAVSSQQQRFASWSLNKRKPATTVEPPPTIQEVPSKPLVTPRAVFDAGLFDRTLMDTTSHLADAPVSRAEEEAITMALKQSAYSTLPRLESRAQKEQLRSLLILIFCKVSREVLPGHAFLAFDVLERALTPKVRELLKGRALKEFLWEDDFFEVTKCGKLARFKRYEPIVHFIDRRLANHSNDYSLTKAEVVLREAAALHCDCLSYNRLPGDVAPMAVEGPRTVQVVVKTNGRRVQNCEAVKFGGVRIDHITRAEKRVNSTTFLLTERGVIHMWELLPRPLPHLTDLVVDVLSERGITHPSQGLERHLRRIVAALEAELADETSMKIIEHTSLRCIQRR